MKIEDLKKKPQPEDIMINTIFVMADAIDILLRDAEKRLFAHNVGLKRDFKYMKNNLMRCIRDTRNALEKYNSMSDNYLTWQDRDCQRTDSNYLCRIILLIADRTAMSDEVEKQIEQYLFSLQQKGMISDDIINSFRLR